MGHAVGMEHEIGWQEFNSQDELTDYEGWPASMELAVSGGSVFDTDLFERQYLVNEQDREVFREIYNFPLDGPVDWAPQSYLVYNDEVLTAAGDSECFKTLGYMISRPSPAVDVMALAVQVFGNDYGDCPDPTQWTSPPVAAPEGMEIYNQVPFTVSFTLNNLGLGDGQVDWEVQLATSADLAGCAAPDCYVMAWGSPTIGANIPYQKQDIDMEIPYGVPAGDYVIRMVMDPDDIWDEAAEDNNIAVWNQPIIALGDLDCGCQTGPSGGVAFAPLLGLLLFGRKRGERV